HSTGGTGGSFAGQAGATGTGGAGTGGAAGGVGADCTTAPCTGLTYCDLSPHQCKPGCLADAACTGLTYCDLSTHQCKPGCASTAACGANKTCDVAAHTCSCLSGFRSCGGACVADSVSQCGPTCLTCQPPANATPACTNGACTFTCNSGFLLC